MKILGGNMEEALGLKRQNTISNSKYLSIRFIKHKVVIYLCLALSSILSSNLYGDCSSENQLICSAVNGLCNRLRNLASCSVLAEHSGRELVVCWLNDNNPADSYTLGFTKWSDLFVQPELKLISCLPKEGAFYGRKGNYESPMLIERSLNLLPLNQSTSHLALSQSSSPGAEFQIDMLTTDPIIILQTIHNTKPSEMSNEEFYQAKRSFYNKLVPVSYVSNNVEKTFSKFPDMIIGVHIRTTDMLKLVHKKNMPSLWKYVDAMKAEIEKNPDVSFFVSADNIIILRYFRKLFGNRVYFYEGMSYNSDGSIVRNSIRATQDALIDLLLLSKTKGIIGTKFSSFSYEAACIGGIPIITEIVH
jgi:hypothetical protein